jgi:cytochrome c peroxidase
MRLAILVAAALIVGMLIQTCRKDAEVKEDVPATWTYDPTPFELEIPSSFPVMEFEEDNPLTVEGVALGRMLYYDPLLDPYQSRSCSSCHVQSESFSSYAEVLPHLNLGWNKAFLWNGKVRGSLEDAMRFEVEEFFQTDLTRLNEHPAYPRRFYEAFGAREITSDLVARALAQFGRTLVSSNARYDQVLRNEEGVFFTEEELRGLEIFNTERGDCFHCHGGILFTDNMFHNTGLDAEPGDKGLSAVTGDPLDRGRFKTPTLRNIEVTAPYMHDGRFRTLEEVVDFYSEGVQNSPTIDPLMKFAHQGGVRLTAQERSDLIAFLKTLTDTTFLTNPAFGNPF